jgi:TolB-like protein
MGGSFMKWRWIVLLLIFILTWPLFSHPQTRDTAKVYKVGILPFVIHSRENLDYLREGIYDILISRVNVEGRIEVIDRAVVDRALYEERPTRLDEATAKRIGMRVGADYLVLGSLTKIGNYISLDARLISITEEKPPLTVYTQHKGLDDVMTKIGDFGEEIAAKIAGRRTVARGRDLGYPDRMQRGSRRFIEREREYERSQTFPFEIKGLDVGDVDGDKKNEVVIMDNSNLYIFKYANDRLTLFRKIESGFEYNHLTIDVADVNRNGYAEIIVTTVVDDVLRSFIIEFEQGKFRKIIDDAYRYFRVLEHPKEGLILMSQRMGTNALFTGPIYRMVWKKNTYETGPKMPFPSGTQIYSVGLGYFRNAKDLELVVLDDRDRLSIVGPNGRPLWTSSDHYGGTNISYDSRRKIDPADPKRRDGSPGRVYIPPRILVRDFDGDGINELIVSKNHSSSYNIFDKIRTFDKAEVCELVWEQNSFVTNWKTRDVEGYMPDFQIKDVDNDGQEDLVAALTNPAPITARKDTSNILFFRLD